MLQTSQVSRASRIVRAGLVALLALVLGTTWAGPAHADGGAYPSSAPTIASGQTVTGGTADVQWKCGFSLSYYCAGSSGVQYYKLPLALGDRVTFQFQRITGYGLGVCVLSPAVTDYTIADAECIASEDAASTGFGQLQYTAGQSATYLVAVYDHYASYHESWAYSMLTSIQTRQAPAISLQGSKSVKVGRTMHLHGTVTPKLRARLTLESKSPAHGWIVADRTKAKGGTYSFDYRPGHTGKHQFRVKFAGKSIYLPAQSKTLRVDVHR
jgi:hypothetical protein